MRHDSRLPRGARSTSSSPARHRLERARRRRALPWIVGCTITALLAALTTVASASTTYDSVSDNFGRNVSSGLGYANEGGRYTTKFSKDNTKVAVRSSSAVVRFTRKGTSFTSTLPRTKLGNTTVRSTSAVTAMPRYGAGVYRSVLARQRGGYSYRATIRTSPTGATILWLSRYDGSTSREVRLARTVSIPQRVTVRNNLHLELRVTGTTKVTLSARAWVRGTATPAFQTKAVDTSTRRLDTAGSIGISSYLSGRSKAATIRIQRLTATRATATTKAADADASEPSTPTPKPSTTPTKPTTRPTTTPTTSPTTPQPPVVSTAGRGAGAVGSASYAVPTGAIFVSSSAPSGGTGTQAAPYSTLTQAVRAAEDGDTIVLRGGNYHEQVATSSKTLTIQNYPGEAVWLEGSSVVGSWTKSDSRWVAKASGPYFPSNASFSPTGDQTSSFINPDYPMAAHPDQVFVDGKSLRQVPSASEVVPGTFAVTYDNKTPDVKFGAKTITIGNDPNGKSVRASDLTYALQLTGEDSVVRGIGIRRYATPMAGSGGAIYVAGEAVGSEISNVTIQDIAGQGLSIIRANVTVKGVTVTGSGLMGIAATKADKLVIRDSVVTGNNVEHFKTEPASGGIKVTRQAGLTVTNNTVSNNIGSTGIWADETVTDIVVTKNTVQNNGGLGIELELSERGIVADNIATGNKDGIRIYNSGQMKVFNNYVGGNSSAGIKLMQDERLVKNVSSSDPRLGAKRPVDPDVQWLNRKITVANNVFDTTGVYQLYAYDIRTAVTADDMVTLVAGNLMGLVESSNTMFLWGLGSGKSTRYQTTTAFSAAKGSGWGTTTADAGATEGGAANARSIASDSSAVPLPADVAAVTGQATGSKRVGPYTTG